MEKIIDIYVRCFEYDVEVFSQPWIYWCVFPAFFYLFFFIIKWWALTLPFWMPIAAVLGQFSVRFGSNANKEQP